MVDVIRERREEDLEPLSRVLAELAWPPGATRERDRLEWLDHPLAQCSWVFDAAPVTVTPTQNVVGHVQIFAPTPAERPLVVAAPEADVLVIGRLFVRPMAHADGIRRFLLTEAIRFVRDRGGVPVLDRAANPALPQRLCERRGFRAVASDDPAVQPMVHHQERPA